jgi:protein-S-isoprenylcysteine O-methyltransferase Ste14
MGDMEDWAEEHPSCDRVQNVMILLTLAVWGLDSFIINWTTFLRGSVPLPLRLLVGLALVVIGAYMSWSSHETIFGGDGPPVLVDSGVFGLCRHPMYLGIISLLLGLSIVTFSIAAFALSVAFFALYDRFATYEEERLIEMFGEDYREYQRRVPKWIPKFW